MPFAARSPRRPELPAFLAAVLFGLSVPPCKLLGAELPPLMLAGLLYLGGGAALSVWTLARRGRGEAPLAGRDYLWLAVAVLCGGAAAPALFLRGLQAGTAAGASLWLNIEAPLTALAAWLFFGEALGPRVWLAAGLMAAGGAVLYWPGEPGAAFGGWRCAAWLTGACAAWGLDNNATRMIAHKDPLAIARGKSLAGGALTLLLACRGEAASPGLAAPAGALAIGAVGYGASLVFYIQALRHLGAGRAAAIFSCAPFIGLAASIAWLREPLGWGLAAAAGLMAAGAWLIVSERHEHSHRHAALLHEHLHRHDEHHRHHGEEAPEEHSHPHGHEGLLHSHPHRPDLHHRHDHEGGRPCPDPN
ncbi:MAG: EamA family transporter [Elusimicrobia bacterium]|nr:EamA family transporter [Elusimicrobiota bacterium]